MYNIVIGLLFLFVLQRFTTSSQKPNTIVRGVHFHQTLLKWSDDHLPQLNKNMFLLKCIN